MFSPCRTAEFGSLGPGLNLDHLAELQADAVAKGALNMDRHVEAAAVRGALHLERSQPLSNLEISALAQKVNLSVSNTDPVSCRLRVDCVRLAQSEYGEN